MANNDLWPELAKDLWRGSPRDYPFRVDITSRIPESFYTAVGHLSKQWADIELFVRSILSKIVGVDYNTALIMTSGMQSRTLLDTTRNAVHHILPQYAASYDVTHVRLQRLHEYRNRIMHSNHMAGFAADAPAGTIQWKVRLNKKGLSFERTWKLNAHQVERHALLARLLVLKLLDIQSDVYHILEERRGSQGPNA